MSKEARQILTLGVTILLLASPALPLDGAPAEIIEIRVEGNSQLSTSAVLAPVATRVGTTYDESMVKADENRLLKTGRFDSVLATRTDTPEGVIVTFIVIERPVVDRIVFQGNKTFKDVELAKELAFGVSDPLNRYGAEAGRKALLTKYQSSGYHLATVGLDYQALETQQQVIYQIVEGPRTVVSKIRFEGRKHFSAFRLRRLIGSSARIWPVVAGYIDVDQIERDVHQIRNLYISEGFLDVQVGRKLEFSPDKKKAKITFLIDEGPRFRINRFIFEGNTVFSDAELGRRLHLQQGSFFVALELSRDIRTVKNTYGELGYIEAQVASGRRFLDPTAKPPDWARELDDGKPALLNVIVKIVESDQFRIGRIDIRGNTVTQSRVIRRELRFYPEQLFNMVAVNESERGLRGTRLFEKASITSIGQAPKLRDVLVQVREGRTGQIAFGGSVSTNTGLLGNIRFSQQNFDILRWPKGWGDLFGGNAFKGAGQTFRIVLEPGVDMMRFHIDWYEPRLFDGPYSLDVKTFLFTREQENYDETRFGGVVSVGRRFENGWYGEVSSQVGGVEIDNLTSDAPPEVISDAGSHAMVGVKGTLVKDRTDSRWIPSDGDRFKMSYEQIGGGFSFGRALGDYRIYRTLHVDALDRKHIIAGRFSAGGIFGDAPVFERFYGGGLSSVRGFDYRGISPRSKGTDEPIGGDFMIFAGCEYTFPLAGRQLRGAVFLDTGTVEDIFEVTTYRASAGMGLRWIVPLLGDVPISLDFGFPLSKDDQDDTEVLSFSFGWTF